MGINVRLPFPGENEIFSIYGRRDLDGKASNGMEDWHSGGDIRPPKICGTVPTEKAQTVMPGIVDWRQNFNSRTSANDSTSYGNALRVYDKASGLRAYTAHASKLLPAYGNSVEEGQEIGTWGPNTTGNSGGVHLHLEFRQGGTGTKNRVCFADVLGIANVKDVTYHREAMEAAAIGTLDVLTAGYRWRTGPGTHNALWLDDNNGAMHYCICGVLYLVYAVDYDNAGNMWCQITPPPCCITAGRAPELWVSAAAGTYLTNMEQESTDADSSTMFDCNVMLRPKTVQQAQAIADKAMTLELPVYYAVSGGDKAALAALADSLGVEHKEV